MLRQENLRQPVSKALHSELLTKISGRFPSRNEYFVISEVRIGRHFFEVFRKFGISEISEISEHSEKPVSEISEIFPKFPNFFRTFFQTFPKFLTEKQGKTSNSTSFFRNFWNLQNFRIITKLFTELEFPNFFPNFFAKILRVQKFRFFPKNFRTLKTEHFRNSRKRKVWKFPSNAGP